MALFNFFNEVPADRKIADLMEDGEAVVFTHMRTGARELGDRLKALVDFDFQTHNENTILKWEGDDYFVMFQSDFDYFDKREKLRELAAKWVADGRPDQVKHI